MTDMRLYLAMGVPTFAILITLVAGIVQNSATNNSIAARFTSLETNMNARFASVDNRFTSIDNAFAAMDNRFNNLEARFETLIGKVVEVDNRLTRVEAILERH